MVGKESIPNSNALQRTDDVLARKHFQRIGVLSDRAWEKKWLLTKTADALSDRGPGYEGDVLSIDEDLP